MCCCENLQSYMCETSCSSFPLVFSTVSEVEWTLVLWIQKNSHFDKEKQFNLFKGGTRIKQVNVSFGSLLAL